MKNKIEKTLQYIGFIILISIAIWLFLPFHSSAATTRKLTVHTGSYSIDAHNLTQSQINAQVNAIVSAIPNANYIAIGTYLDYDSQIALWATAIHNKHRKMFLRSSGFNAWNGTNGVQVTMTPTDSRVWMSTFLRLHYSVFKSGDVFETVPDEPENGNYWYRTYGSSGIGTNATSEAEFNTFIQGSISDANNIFNNELHISGIQTGYIFTNPSASKDIITDQTASILSAIGTDDYPEVSCLTASDCGAAMQSELNNWIVSSHPSKAKHITFGPDVYNQMDQQTQADIYTQEFNAITSTLTNLDGITVWQAGANDNNPKSRLFDYVNGQWIPRQATQVINQVFSTL